MRFRLIHLLLLVTVSACLVLPAQSAVKSLMAWIEKSQASAAQKAPARRVVSVPDSDTNISGGIFIRPNHVTANRSLMQLPSYQRPAVSSDNLIITVTPRIIIQPEEEEQIVLIGN